MRIFGGLKGMAMLAWNVLTIMTDELGRVVTEKKSASPG